MAKVLRVFIVDDSAVFRSQIRASLEGVAGVEVVGFASQGKNAMEVLKKLPVDIITLDLEMPVMNGIETLLELKKQGNRAKVIVFSSHTKRGAESTLAALNAGASDFITKPTLENPSSMGSEGTTTPAELIRSLLLPKVLQFSDPESRDLQKTKVGSSTSVRLGSHSSPHLVNGETLDVIPSFQKIDWGLFFPKVLLIASSTGGPNALEKIFSNLKPPFLCPIVIAQHMPPLFTASLAERLQKLSGIPTAEAQHMQTLKSGCAYIAPGDHHLRLVRTESGVAMVLDQGPQRNSVRPAADFLFESAADVYRSGCLGLVLTGMGGDGKEGAVAVKKAGGAIVIQSQETCVVFGMPAAVQAAGAYDQSSSLEGIAELLAQLRLCGRTSKVS